MSPVVIQLAADICEFLDGLDRLIKSLDNQKYQAMVRRGIQSLFEGGL